MKQYSPEELDHKITKFMDRKYEQFPELRTPTASKGLARSWHLVREEMASPFNKLTAIWS